MRLKFTCVYTHVKITRLWKSTLREWSCPALISISVGSCHSLVFCAGCNVNRYGLETTKTEVTIQKWGLGFSFPNPLGQLLRQDDQGVWTICVSSVPLSFILYRTERFSYDLEIKTREHNRTNTRTEIERFDWFIERIQTRVAFNWLSERFGEKTLCPRTF